MWKPQKRDACRMRPIFFFKISNVEVSLNKKFIPNIWSKLILLPALSSPTRWVAAIKNSSSWPETSVKWHSEKVEAFWIWFLSMKASMISMFRAILLRKPGSRRSTSVKILWNSFNSNCFLHDRMGIPFLHCKNNKRLLSSGWVQRAQPGGSKRL